MTDIKRIASADLVGFCLDLQQAVQEGYQLLFDNANCPVQIGTLLTCGVAKIQPERSLNEEQANKESEKSNGSNESKEEVVATTPQRGRKPRV